MSHAEHRQVLDDLIAKGAGADDEDAAARQQFLLPPLDSFQSRKATLRRPDRRGCWDGGAQIASLH